MKKNPFQSRKFLIAILVIAFAVLAAFAPPEFVTKVTPFLPLVASVVISVVAGITIEDSSRAWADRPKTNESAIRDVFEELMNDWFGDDEEPQPDPVSPNTANTASGVG